MSPTMLASRLAELRPQLLGSVPWSPLDFIRGVSNDGDRQVQFDGLLRPLTVGDDLRIVAPIDARTAVAVFAERLPWDSSFFGYEVARLHGVFPVDGAGYRADADYVPALQQMLALARERGIRYLFAVIDARDLPTLRALTALSFLLIETRIYYSHRLRDHAYPKRSRCRPATAADVDALIEMSRTVDNPYDRFNSDPFVGAENARRLIARWIRASIVDGFADVTLIPDSPAPGSLMTVKYHRDKAAAWGATVGQKVLAIASPRSDNRMIGLVSETMYHAREQGCDHMLFSTQIANRKLIRCGEHVGYKFGRGEYVFRILL